MQGLLGRSLCGSGGTGIGGITGRTSNWVAASGVPVYGQSRTLLMHEISASAGEQMSANEALAVDVACLVYDVSDAESFRYVANIFLVSFLFINIFSCVNKKHNSLMFGEIRGIPR